jgi:hypothetical protein
MNNEERIAEYLRRTLVPRLGVHSRGLSNPFRRVPFGQPAPHLPTIEDLASELIADAEFRSLKLGTWFGTVDGQLITKAVDMALPPGLRAEFDLAVAALKLAAELQRPRKFEQAGPLALVSVAAIVFVGWAAVRKAA